MLLNGNLMLRWNETVVYWDQGVNSSVDVNPWGNVVKGYNPRFVNLSATLQSPTLELQAVGILAISDPVLSSPVIMAYSSDFAEGTDVLRFLKLGNDGNMKIYSSERGSGTAIPRWAAVQDQCQVFGYCGSLGICFHSKLGQQDNPSCECPSGNFEPISTQDARKGCKRKVELKNCPGNSTMLELNHTRFSDYKREPLAKNELRVSESARSSCILDCLKSNICVASASADDGTRTCYTQSSDFFSGYRVSSLPGTLYIKVCGQGLPNPVSSSKNMSENADFLGLDHGFLVVVTVPSVVGFIIFQIGFFLWYRWNSPVIGRSLDRYKLLEYVSSVPVQFTYKELVISTKGFKDRVGAGESGAVYRGVLSSRDIVAVKRLYESNLGEMDFRKKVSTICSTHHLNLVRMIGYCCQKTERLLVYEFAKNGSLDSLLFQTEDRNSLTCLSWEKRFNIALGSAKGIAYLHEECRECIVHLNIKPENILLDENYHAKVSDFGLAELMDPRGHHRQELSSIQQTSSYISPERLANLPTTSKADIYSFGMVLLEILSGRRSYEVSIDTGGLKFSTWVREQFEKGSFLSIIDRRLAKGDVDMEQVQRAIITALWCIRNQPSQRPTMRRVVQMLEGHLEVELPPPLDSVHELSYPISPNSKSTFIHGA
ncbi:hypothetical protein MLD38_000306 [Melastoma candidum]|nr:hypothetical protein MLD38_000306 [Melastoma candidum]